jgi:hypothetical protein
MCIRLLFRNVPETSFIISFRKVIIGDTLYSSIAVKSVNAACGRTVEGRKDIRGSNAY